MNKRKHHAIGIFCLLIIFTLWSGSCTLKEVPSVQPPPIVQPPVQSPPKPAKIAVVLGAGSSKGFAHIGVLKILETNKVPIHMIVGTSVGSAVGSLYAYGYNAFQLQKVSFSIEKGDVVDLIIPDNGFIKGEKLEEFINKTLNQTPMEKLKIPFYAVATDVQSGQEVVFGRGNTGQAVRASCSIPGVFRPVRIGDRVYVDGGVVSPVAVDAAKRLGADVVIAVDISKDADRPKPESTIETIFQSLNIMYSKLASIQINQADVVIRPKVGYINSSDFSKRHEAILEGEKAAIEALPLIRGILVQLQQEGRLE
ncbi:MAG TPA: patatin-like phospholipase family protein [Thermodesulfobacteriota bacterium]|nr:patatin-like phospholipase family protein [Thermodesulfobacteriota bacterium]